MYPLLLLFYLLAMLTSTDSTMQDASVRCVSMHLTDSTMQDASVRCMETLSLANKDYWKAIRDFGMSITDLK